MTNGNKRSTKVVNNTSGNRNVSGKTNSEMNGNTRSTGVVNTTSVNRNVNGSANSTMNGNVRSTGVVNATDKTISESNVEDKETRRFL